MATSKKEAEAKASSELENMRSMLTSELEKTKRELRELGLTIEQSQSEVNKVTQRHAQTTMHLQQIQAQIESLPRQEVRSAYDSALDAQQRLFVMRGQIDRLQSDKTHVEHYLAGLEQFAHSLETFAPILSGGSRTSAMAQTVEMMIQGQEAERQRLARKMHDGPAQALSNFILQTEIAVRLFDIDQGKAKEELSSLKGAASSTLQKVRDFIFELRPMMLDDLGLIPTVSRYIESTKAQAGFDIRFAYTGMDQRLEPFLEVLIFRSVQELLGNAARHSQATQVKVQIDAAAGEVKVSVDDNGHGFDENTIAESGGMGLKVIRDRVEMLGGDMEIDSAPGQGTRVTFSVPGAPVAA